MAWRDICRERERERERDLEAHGRQHVIRTYITCMSFCCAHTQNIFRRAVVLFLHNATAFFAHRLKYKYENKPLMLNHLNKKRLCKNE